VFRNNTLIASGLVLVGIGLSLILIFLFGGTSKPTQVPAVAQLHSPTSEPLIPTRTRARPDTPSPVAAPVMPIVTPTARQVSKMPSSLWQGRPRWGIGVAIGPISRYDIAELSLGWYLDWRAALDPPKPGGIEYVQMVRLKSGDLQPDEATLARIAQADPGSIWMIGNEPDVKWQDDVVPAAYARLYHRAYVAIKGADPTAQVAIGGVSQPTPLRLRYLEQVLEAYQQQNHQEMPVDVWNVHNFILREERGSWGVDIPPGLTDDSGMFYQVEDSGNLDLFRRQMVEFRKWMAARGFQNRPLIVSEYGIPMPEDYGFPPERVLSFLIGTFDFFLAATDPALGYPADDYKLVQRWCWYSLDDTTYPTGRLFDPQTGEISDTGKGFAGLVAPSRSK
jgi:hypothetical protein